MSQSAFCSDGLMSTCFVEAPLTDIVGEHQCICWLCKARLECECCMHSSSRVLISSQCKERFLSFGEKHKGIVFCVVDVPSMKAVC